MNEIKGSYTYTDPHQMFPMLPGEHKLERLRLLAADVIAGAGELAAHGMPRLRTLPALARGGGKQRMSECFAPMPLIGRFVRRSTDFSAGRASLFLSRGRHRHLRVAATLDLLNFHRKLDLDALRRRTSIFQHLQKTPGERSFRLIRAAAQNR